MKEEDHKRPAPEKPLPSEGDEPTIDTRRLLGERREVVIVHNGERYRLRATAKGKLILTK
jgi:hemin uptake protein HemP